MIHKLEIWCGIFALLAGIALIVFSVINIPTSMLWQVIFGVVLMVLGLVYMILYARSRRNN